MKRILISAMAVLLLLAVAGCGKEKVSLDPPSIKYGEDISEMGMAVVDPRFTVAALPEKDNSWILFDDIGELLKYHDRFPDVKFRATWVHDYLTEEWIHAEDAWYVESAGFTTPMGWLVGAFAKESDAQAFLTEHGGTMMTWAEANARQWVDPPAPDDPIYAGSAASPTAGHDHGSTSATPVATPAAIHDHPMPNASPVASPVASPISSPVAAHSH